MNKVILQGRLTRDPELKYTTNGTAIANFTMAVNRRFPNKQTGEREADFINCVVWQKPAETAANYLKKGFRVGIVGRWESRNYENQEGKKVYVNECIVEEMDFIDFEKDGQAAGQNNGNSNQNNQGNTNTPYGNQNGNSGEQGRSNDKPNNNKGFTRVDEDPFAGNGQIDISDDDLPF